jgi:hypothetical protein
VLEDYQEHEAILYPFVRFNLRKSGARTAQKASGSMKIELQNHLSVLSGVRNIA